MTESQKQGFDWNEVADLFGIAEETPDLVEEERDKILERINSLSCRYGREYVIKKITLQTTH
ncbi:hypothetical protein [Desulfovibrio sp. Huiquan2017]|uniref:hypothetical protein n=1 Tax=Desulfovibrio sp. Huiquan2017 TaxID=2816861 RepID=UPI001A90E16A|nr:hypothetical protein [Desulfovibrio sp. Huiquan2017]